MPVNRMPHPHTAELPWQREYREACEEPTTVRATVKPLDTTATHNPLRPMWLSDMVGQAKLRDLLRRVVDASAIKGVPLDHLLLVGPSGVGKTTIAMIVANELGSAVYAVEAPVSHETLLDLRESMIDGDVLFIDEIHQQAVMERRGRSANTQPEVLFSVMEDRTLISGTEVLDFPKITVIGATTDEGMLPDPFINRFPLRPNFEGYSITELALIALDNAVALGHVVIAEAAIRFAMAARGVPRHVNNYVRNAAMLTTGTITEDIAVETIEDVNGCTEDGLTVDMQKVLVFLYSRCRQESPKAGVSYKASVNSLATAIGKSRDTKAIALRVEPWLIREGYLQVGHGGRRLTDHGVKRAIELIQEGVTV